VTADTHLTVTQYSNLHYLHAIFMEAIPLCLSLNKSHLFSLTQHTFILIQLVILTRMLYVSACNYAIFRHVNTNTLQRKIKR